MIQERHHIKVRPQKKQIQIETPKLEWSGVSYAKKTNPLAFERHVFLRQRNPWTVDTYTVLTMTMTFISHLRLVTVE